MPSSPTTGNTAVHTKTALATGGSVEKPSVRGPVSPGHPSAPSPPTSSTVSTGDASGANRRAHAQNGHADQVNGHDESEAETVVLSDAEHKRKRARRGSVKAEDDEGDAPSPRSRSPAVRRKSSGAADGVADPLRQPRSERNGHKALTNGTHHGQRGNTKSPDTMGRSRSNHSDGAPERRRKSASADGAGSPNGGSDDRGRASSLGGTRKRKIREEHHLRNIEPPRQRLKSDPVGKGPVSDGQRGAPASPTATTPGLRSHKRSASIQSLATGLSSRRRRETSNTHESKQWRSDSSSEASSSPQPTTPALQYLPAARTKRSSHRSMTSPARGIGQMGHPKKNVDKFGATRLAREGEKGNLDAVRAAYDAAPEELDQADFAGFAPIQKASLNGHADVVGFLISKGCRTDCQSKEHDTPLIDAVENGHLDVVRLLLDAGVNPHHQNKKGERAVDVLNHEEDNVDEIESLLRKAMLEHASDDDSMSVDVPLTTRDLLTGEQRNDLLYVESTLSNLRKYAARGDAVAVDHFLGSITPDTACVTGAARGGHEMVLSLLLASPSDRMEKDPDPAKQAETPLIAAIGRGHLGILRILLDQDNFNPTRRTKDGKTYHELAEELKGPKWQQEVDLLKERYDAYRAKKQAQKKRPLGPPAADKAGKSAKLRSPRSPETKRAVRASSPAASTDAREGRMRPPKIKQERPSESTVTAPLKKVRPAEGASPPDAVKHPRRAEDASGKGRRRRVVDEDSSEDDRDGAATSHKPGRSRRISEASLKGRKESRPTAPTADAHKAKVKARRPSTTSLNGRDNQTEHGQKEDEDMPDAPVPVPTHATVATNAKQHTPEPVRLNRIQDAEKEANRQRLAAERERLAEEQRAAEAIEARKRAERQARLEKLPLALRHACERGANRPLHFSATEPGIAMVFLPLQVTPLSHEANEPASPTDPDAEEWMLSFQAVGILGLPELDVTLSYPDWETRPVTPEQRQEMVKKYDISSLSRTTHAPCEDQDDFDPAAIDRAVVDTKEKLLALEPLVWIKVAQFEAAVAQQEWLRSLTLSKSKLCLRPGDATETRTLGDMIKSIIAQHQAALLTPSTSAAANSPELGSNGLAPAAGDAMDVDQPGNGPVPAPSTTV